MKSGDHRPDKDMRKAHRERAQQRAREAQEARMDVEAPPQELAGQRRDRGEDHSDPSPPTKQVREESAEQAGVSADQDMEQDLEQMYLENDNKAYALDRQLEKNRKFHFQRGHAAEEEKLFRMSRKNKKDQAIYRIKLTSSTNKRAFKPEDITSQVIATLQEVDIEIEPEDVIVTPMTATGPYVVALHKEAAEYILEEGVMLADSNQDPPFTQFFAAKPFNASTNDIKISNNSDDIAMSIYFNLGAEYTGLRMKDLSEPKNRITAALTEVFGQPSDFLSYTLIQPKTPLGFYRNAIRAIIKYNKQNERTVEPDEVNDLAKIRYIGMGFGKRPLSSTMPTGWRAAYGIEPCCFRQKNACSKSNGKDCDLRDQVWAKFSYTDKNLRPDFAEKKRKREEEQKIKRDQAIASYQQLQAERNAADCCNFFLQGKCSKSARECSFRHRSLKYSKLKIVCASAKPNLKWVCKWTSETCPYSHHIDASNPTNASTSNPDASNNVVQDKNLNKAGSSSSAQ